VLNPDSCRIKTQRPSLYLSTVNELGSSYKNSRKPSSFQISDVVHTARRAAASIGKSFDHDIALRSDFVTQINRGGLSKGWLTKPLYPETSLNETFLDPIKEVVSPGFADVK
jgi:hypothetical protein|tara:strand:- start:1664 stop:1999 length:336 start_codon:yes stop_codon:yes gene_type:complete